MRIYKPLNASAVIHKQSTRAEFELLRNKLDVASFSAYDVASVLSKTDLANLEQVLESYRDKVQNLYERI